MHNLHTRGKVIDVDNQHELLVGKVEYYTLPNISEHCLKANPLLLGFILTFPSPPESG